MTNTKPKRTPPPPPPRVARTPTTTPTNQTTGRTPPPPPPRKVTSTTKPVNQPVSERVAQQRIAIIAAGEFAHASMRKPRASVNHVTHAHQRMMHLVSDEVLAMITSTTDSVRICDLIATFVGNCAQEGFKLGVQHGAAS